MSRQRGGRRRHPFVRIVAELATIGLGVYLVIPQLAGLEATGEQLAHATWWLPLTIVLLEAASLAAYGELMLTMLRRSGAAPPRGLVQRSVIVGTGLGRSLPAGNAAAFGVIVAAFRRAGVDGVVAATSIASAALLSSAVLAALLPIGVALTLTTGRLGGIAVSAMVVAGAVLLAAAVVPVAVRRPASLGARVRQLVARVARGPLRGRLDPNAIGASVTQGAEGVRGLATDRRALATATVWAAANWLLDVMVVLVLALTIGRGTPPAAILLAYIVAQLAASIPLTPGGVGIVEAAMIASLVASGAPGAAATTTVLGWRLISHWLPILVGLGLLPSVTRQRLLPTADPRTPQEPRDDGD